ncbi:L-arabinose transport system permease protein AraQ [compost metagenome]
MSRVIAMLVLVVGAVFMAAPFALMLGTSLMTYAQTVSYPPEFLPSPATLANFRKALAETPLLRYLGNSLLVAGVTVVGQVLTGSMAGYAFARLRFKGRNALFFTVLATMMVPVYITLVPLYVMMASLGWVDTYQALILPGLTGAFGIFLFRQWFLNLPSELEDAARIDGCSPWDLYWRIAMPTAWPAIATLAIFEFLASWNTFLWPLVITHSDALRTLPVGLAAFKSAMREATDWGLLMAATTVAVVPALLVFWAGQRHFVRGMLEGAVKD